MAKLTEEEKTGMSPDEIALLEAEGADEALQQEAGAADADGDGMDADDPKKDDATKAEASDDANKGDEDKGTAATGDNADGDAKAGEEGLTPEQLEAVSKFGEQPQAAQAKPTTYETANVEELTTKRTELRAQKREIETKWSAGELSDEDRATQLEQIDDQVLELTEKIAHAKALADINEQNAKDAAAKREADESAALQALIKSAKAAKTIDYAADADACAEYDVALAMVKVNSNWANRSAAEQVQEAHRRVLVGRNIATAPAPSPAQAPTPAAPRQVPQTLSGLPNAGSNTVGDDLMEQFGNLDADQQEEFLAKLPAHQVERLMRQADSQSFSKH